MDIEIPGLVRFVFAVTSVGGLVHEHQMDILYSSYIENSVHPRTRISSISNQLTSVPKSLIIAAIVLAMTVAGCAPNRPQHDSDLVQQEARARAVRAALATDRYSEQPAPSRIPPATLALLAPQPAPDCEFKGMDPKTVDEDEWPRLKLEYERQCYKNAEQAVRKRLRLLQASALVRP